jgi:DNA-binding LacI/PurR family transcriptional regulator
VNIFSKVQINPNRETTLADQIRQQISWLIVTGKLKANDPLPSVRIFAEQLSVNMHTVRSGYKKLEAEGLVETRPGARTRVLPYDPLRIAKKISQLRTHVVGIILPSLTNPFYHKVLQGLEEIAAQNDTLLLVSSTHESGEAVWRIFNQFLEKRVDGVIVISHDDLDVLQDASAEEGIHQLLPIVTIDMPGVAGYSVNMDLESAGYQATRYLLELGHPNVLFLAPNMLEAPNLYAVYCGYQRAVQEEKRTSAAEDVVEVNGWSIEAGKEGGRELLKRSHQPSAVFAATDLLAIGAAQALQQAGIRIPEDVALVGFNDIPLAELVQPPLTTVAAPALEMGREGMKMLQRLIAGKYPTKHHCELPVSLVVRASCCPYGG